MPIELTEKITKIVEMDKAKILNIRIFVERKSITLSVGKGIEGANGEFINKEQISVQIEGERFVGLVTKTISQEDVGKSFYDFVAEKLYQNLREHGEI